MTELPAPSLAELQAHARAQSGAAPIVLLDVREPWEWALGRIEVDGVVTLHVPMGDVPSRVQEIDPDATIVCYCHHGVRSRHVAAFLEQQGYDGLYNLSGGIDAWSRLVDPAVPRY